MATDPRSREELLAEIENLRVRLEDAEEILRAIQVNEVDAFVVTTAQGDRIFTLEGADYPYRVLVESMNEGAATLTPDSSVMYSNHRLANLLKIPLEKLIGSTLRSYVTPADAPIFAALLKQSVQQRCKEEIELIAGDGTSFPALLSCSQLGLGENQKFINVVVTDITARKQIEEALRESERQFHQLADAMPQMAWITDPQGRILFTNQRWCEFTGLSHQQSALNSEIQSAIHPDDFPRMVQKWEYALATGSHYDCQVRFRQAVDGVYRWFLSRGVALKDRQGHIVRWFRTATDIEDQKRLEKSLSDVLIDVQRHDAQMIILNRMSDLLLSCETGEEAYEIILRSAEMLFDGYVGGLAIREENSLDLRVVASWGETNYLPLTFALRDCWGLRRGEIHEVADPAHSVHCQHFTHPPEGAYLCVPLTVGGQTLGLLQISAGYPLSEKQFQELRNLTLMVSESIKLALSNLQLRDALREQATHDALTGLFNRRYLDETLPRELHRHQRSGEPITVAMLDLDHFKRFNDSYGHEAGDIALQRIGDLLRRSLRAGDLACRYGGEELTVIMPGSSLDDAQTRLDDLRRAIMYLHLSYRNGELPAMTVSIGVAAAGAEETDATVLLGRADAALYQAKEQGRNRVVVAATG